MTSITIAVPVTGWLCPLEEVPDPVFATGMLGGGVAIDPLADTVHAPAYGEVVAFHEAGHAVTLRLADGVELLIHFGLETVRLGGSGFTPLVHVGDSVVQGQALLKVELDDVARGARSLVTPLILTETNGYTVDWRAPFGPVEMGQPLAVLIPCADAARPRVVEAQATPAIRRDVRVPLAHGLHARPSARLADAARDFSAQVRVACREREAALASPSAMLRLAVKHGDTITLIASGTDAEAAIEALAAMIESGMGEGKPFADEATATPATQTPAAAILIDPPKPGELIKGVTAAPGLAIGTVWRPARPDPQIDAIGQGPEVEQAKLDEALRGLRARLAADAAGDGAQAEILSAHLSLLDDPELIDAAVARIAANASAGLAWRGVLLEEAQALRATGDERLMERAADFIDLDERLQWQLLGQEPPVITPPAGAILVAEDLLPSQVAALDASLVCGLATALGGPTSHVAIIAASRGIPALVALGPRILDIPEGTVLALDTATASLHVDPAPEALADAGQRLAAQVARKASALASAHRPAETADGVRVEVFANLAKLEEVPHALAQGAEGCGLLRTEFLFLDRASAPDEDEQAATYSAIAKGLEGRPLIVRLLDVGGDKPASYLPIDPEENPALGLRGIRVGLARPDVLRTQLRAILRAGSSGDVRIMAPMIARVAELRDVRAALVEEAAALDLPVPQLGVMVETPAAAVMADRLAAECDFLSIGTNDLTQYTLAMDRGNPAVAGGLDGMDPAVLRLMRQTCLGAAARGKWVGVCGGLASDPLAVPILIGLGVHELSASPSTIPEVKATVAAVRKDRCRALAEAVLDAVTAAEVRALAADMIREAGL